MCHIRGAHRYMMITSHIPTQHITSHHITSLTSHHITPPSSCMTSHDIASHDVVSNPALLRSSLMLSCDMMVLTRIADSLLLCHPTCVVQQTRFQTMSNAIIGRSKDVQGGATRGGRINPRGVLEWLLGACHIMCMSCHLMSCHLMLCRVVSIVS